MASTDTINYALRPNKNIERKLIVECLANLKPAFDIGLYCYIGMGSFWYADFVLLHRQLGINKMISIEREQNKHRARFNKPLNCIRIEPGDTTQVLPDLAIGTQDCIIWLDYDRYLEPSCMTDLSIVCGELRSGSVLLVTLNAHHGQLKNRKNPDGDAATEKEVLKRYFGSPGEDLAPLSLNAKNFPKTLARLLLNDIEHKVRRADPSKEFLAIVTFLYADGAPMVTVGGLVLDEHSKSGFHDCRLFEKLEFATGDRPFTIQVPPLTLREKIALDRALPKVEGQDAEQEGPWKYLTSDQLEDYVRFYRYYPAFGELQF